MENDRRVVVIAEVGECYNGDLAVARRLIEVAKHADCDYAKFQTLDATQVSEDDPERDWFLRVALDAGEIDQLVAYGREVGIGVLFTPENAATAAWLFERKLPAVKLASSSLVDHELLRYVNGRFETVFMSTGMGTLDEITAAVACLDRVPNLFILHCVSEYPTGPLLERRGLRALAPEDVRLNMMKMLMALFPQHHIGYSDHTAGLLAPLAAVAAGARVVEKHLTLDRETPVRHFHEGGEYLGTDHVLSLEPDELRLMMRQLREVESMLGPWRWERSEGEQILREFLRGRFQQVDQSSE
ncbi:MAG: N-acetylneuraminate synthase family protein [Chloroflexi bacterium]|nr:N-acetylneuraminate synthase family protein [Chloroflexota bacterium]